MVIRHISRHAPSFYCETTMSDASLPVTVQTFIVIIAPSVAAWTVNAGFGWFASSPAGTLAYISAGRRGIRFFSRGSTKGKQTRDYWRARELQVRLRCRRTRETSPSRSATTRASTTSGVMDVARGVTSGSLSPKGTNATRSGRRMVARWPLHAQRRRSPVALLGEHGCSGGVKVVIRDPCPAIRTIPEEPPCGCPLSDVRSAVPCS